ncbi:MAG: hypothetical protein Q7S96_04625 [bacterium]|nr:hypothetical protein [bacterium]
MTEGGNAKRWMVREVLLVLLVLYPLLLLLDDLEPGFVRSVINPHAFLLALIAVAMIAPQDATHAAPSSAWAWLGGAFLAALVVGGWSFWTLGGGTLAAVVALLAAVAVGTVFTTLREDV